MKFSILDQKKFPLLSREEYNLRVEFESTTPKNEEIKSGVVSFLKVENDAVVIKRVGQIYGMREAVVNAYVYNDLNKFNQIEIIKNKKYKTKLAEEKKKKLEEKKASSQEQPKVE